MSRIGKLPIVIPAGVTVTVKDNVVTVKGPKGELSQSINPDLTIEQADGHLTVSRPSDDREHRAQHGLYRALIHNMVVGVSEGYKKEMELVGVGYRATSTGQVLELALGYSHAIYIKLPKEFKRKKEEELKKEKLEKETQAAKYIEENKDTLVIKFEGERHDLYNHTEEVLCSTEIKDMLKVISKSSIDLTKYRYDYFMDDYSIKEYFKCSYCELVEIYNLSIKNIEEKEKAEKERLRKIEEDKQKHYNEVLKKAQETGEKQVLKTRTEEVQREESDIDVIVTYLYPDGHEETRRNPAY